MENHYEQSGQGCCPRFSPAPWNEKEITWQGKLFIKDKVKSFFHIPLNFEKVMVRNMKMITDAGALNPEMLMLSDEKSLWGADIFIAVTKEIQGAETARISGTFLSKVFEGPYKNMGKWIKEMKTYAASQNKEIKKMYFFYTTCPKCAKVYGKNYIVIFAMV